MFYVGIIHINELHIAIGTSTEFRKLHDQLAMGLTSQLSWSCLIPLGREFESSLSSLYQRIFLRSLCVAELTM